MKVRGLLLFLCVLLFASCVMEKRHYRHGYYLNFDGCGKSDADNCPPDTATVSFTEQNPVIEEESAAPTVVEQEEGRVDSLIETTMAGVKPVCNVHESPMQPIETTDDPQPEEKDKINPKIAWLTAGGFVLELTLSMILLFGTVSWVGWFVLLAMLLGIGLFLLATHLRSHYSVRIAGGDKDPRWRLSAHYHRFRVLLHMYFAAGAIGLLGWFFLYTAGATSGVLSLLGVILFSSGVVLLAGLALVLLVLFVLYFLRWRQDPTGFKPPRRPHPTKEG